MYDDSVQAIELDDSYFKAYLKNGEACIELGKNQRFQNTEMIDKGLKRLQKALMLVERIKQGHQSFESKKILENQVSKQILRGQKIKWYKERQLKEHAISLFKSTIEVNLSDLTEMANELLPEMDKKIDIPDFLLCRISDDLMNEPVMLSSGFTYEKIMI